MRSLLIVMCLAGLTGCTTTADCGPDWFAVGERDGRINAGSQVERYAARCGVPVDRARYEEGYQQGFAQRPRPVV